MERCLNGDIHRHVMAGLTDPLHAKASMDELDTIGVIGQILDSQGLAICLFDAEDRTLLWNRTFLRFFPEHDGHVHVGEPYARNLERFYAARLTGPVLWCVVHPDLFAPGLEQAGLLSDRVIHVEAGDDKAVLVCMEEGLRHGGLGAVVGEVPKLPMAARGTRLAGPSAPSRVRSRASTAPQDVRARAMRDTSRPGTCALARRPLSAEPSISVTAEQAKSRL